MVFVCVCVYVEGGILHQNLFELNFSPHPSYFTWSSDWIGCPSCLYSYLEQCCDSCCI